MFQEFQVSPTAKSAKQVKDEKLFDTLNCFDGNKKKKENATRKESETKTDLSAVERFPAERPADWSTDFVVEIFSLDGCGGFVGETACVSCVTYRLSIHSFRTSNVLQ